MPRIHPDPFNPRNPRLFFSAAKNRQSEYGEHNTDQRSRYGPTKRKRSSRLADPICAVMVCCCLHGTEPAPKARSITRNSNRGAAWLCLHAMYFKHPKVDISENANALSLRLLAVAASDYLSAGFDGDEAASFWKRGSFRSGSNIGSSRSSAGVSGMCEANGPSYGIESNFCKATMERS
jgi:hypothetical protein